jgi:hypothetical protein
MMRSSVVLTSLCLALLGCGGGETPAERSPHTFTITEGDTVTYQKEVARVGDKIVCVVAGKRVGAYVQKPGTGVSGVGDGPGGGASVDVVTQEDGLVVASCEG